MLILADLQVFVEKVGPRCLCLILEIIFDDVGMLFDQFHDRFEIGRAHSTNVESVL